MLERVLCILRTPNPGQPLLDRLARAKAEAETAKAFRRSAETSLAATREVLKRFGRAELALDDTATQEAAEEAGVIGEHVAAYKEVQVVARAAAEAAKVKP
ncbi:MAG: hypothetical protein IMZ50_01860 [Candidatus Atribacteria bacterium]|nr:hypothetical protein [Candidatus Atribacteria bacterium]